MTINEANRVADVVDGYFTDVLYPSNPMRKPYLETLRKAILGRLNDACMVEVLASELAYLEECKANEQSV